MRTLPDAVDAPRPRIAAARQERSCKEAPDSRAKHGVSFYGGADFRKASSSLGSKPAQRSRLDHHRRQILQIRKNAHGAIEATILPFEPSLRQDNYSALTPAARITFAHFS